MTTPLLPPDVDPDDPDTGDTMRDAVIICVGGALQHLAWLCESVTRGDMCDARKCRLRFEAWLCDAEDRARWLPLRRRIGGRS